MFRRLQRVQNLVAPHADAAAVRHYTLSQAKASALLADMVLKKKAATKHRPTPDRRPSWKKPSPTDSATKEVSEPSTGHDAAIEPDEAQRDATALSKGDFVVILRSRESRDSEGDTFRSNAPEDAIRLALDAHVAHIDEPLIRWSDKESAVALDFDRPANAPRLVDEIVHQYFDGRTPSPMAWWITHGGGLRVLFTAARGFTALELAGAWLLLAQPSALKEFRLEVKADSRHPSGMRGCERCGDVHYMTPAPFDPRSEQSDCTNGVTSRDTWLETHGLTLGRHSSQYCPGCGRSSTSGNDALVLSPTSVHCFRCGKHWTWGELTGAAPNNEHLDAARHFVHLAHQWQVVKSRYPNFPKTLFEHGWRAILRSVHKHHLNGKSKKSWRKRISDCGTWKHDFCLAEGARWLHAAELTVFDPRHSLPSLPYVIDSTHLDRLKNHQRPPGFTLLRAFPATLVLPPNYSTPARVVVARLPSKDGSIPVNLEQEPTEAQVAAVIDSLRMLLPGLNTSLLRCLLLASLLARSRSAQPPVIAITGQTGTGKTITVKLAAALLGTEVADIHLGEAKETRRQIGLALESSQSPLLIDEIGRTTDLFHRLQPILELNGQITFDAKHANERKAEIDAPVVLASAAFPKTLTGSRELGRRAVVYELSERDHANWSQLGDIRNVRLTSLQAPLDVLVSEAWHLIRKNPSVDWKAHSLERLGARELASLEQNGPTEQERVDAIRALYVEFTAAREAQLSDDGWNRGWLRCTHQSEGGRRLLTLLVDAPTEERHELLQVDLAVALGFSDPRLKLHIGCRTGEYRIKFTQANTLKGHGLSRSEFPALDSADQPATGWELV